MLLDGKYHEAAKLAYDEWHKSPMPQGGGFGGGPAFTMRLDYPKTASVKDYLRTVDFESTELKVHWTDDARRVGAPDFHVPARQRRRAMARGPERDNLVNLRIALRKVRAVECSAGSEAFGASGLGAPLKRRDAARPGLLRRRRARRRRHKANSTRTSTSSG
jgi:hypothetical protein